MKAAAFGRYSGQAMFAGVAMALLLVATLLSAIGWRAYREVSVQILRFRTYKAMQQEAGSADSLSSIYTAILKDMRNVRGSLPAHNQGSYVLHILVEEADRAGLGIAGITALDEVPFPGYRELPCELNLIGGFTNLVQYLHSLETRGMVVRVRRLSARAEAINKSRLTARLELSLFVPGEGRVAAAAMDGFR